MPEQFSSVSQSNSLFFSLYKQLPSLNQAWQTLSSMFLLKQALQADKEKLITVSSLDKLPNLNKTNPWRFDMLQRGDDDFVTRVDQFGIEYVANKQWFDDGVTLGKYDDEPIHLQGTFRHVWDSYLQVTMVVLPHDKGYLVEEPEYDYWIYAKDAVCLKKELAKLDHYWLRNDEDVTVSYDEKGHAVGYAYKGLIKPAQISWLIEQENQQLENNKLIRIKKITKLCYFFLDTTTDLINFIRKNPLKTLITALILEAPIINALEPIINSSDVFNQNNFLPQFLPTIYPGITQDNNSYMLESFAQIKFINTWSNLSKLGGYDLSTDTVSLIHNKNSTTSAWIKPYFRSTVQQKMTAYDYYEIGLSYQQTGNYQAAIENYSQAIALDCNNPFYYYRRGYAKHENSQFYDAIADYYHAIYLHQDGNAYYYFRRANSRYVLGRYQEALDDYEYGIQLRELDFPSNPNNPQFYFGKAITQHALENFEAAISDYSKAIDCCSTNPNAKYYFGRAESYVANGDYQNAITDYTSAINLNPNNAEYYFKRGETKSLINNYQDAIIDYNSAISNTTSPLYSYYFKRGQAKQLLTDYEDAIIDYDNAICIESNDASAFFYKGLAQHLLANNTVAINSFSQALNLNATNIDEIYFHSAISNHMINNDANALIELNHAIANNATNPAFYFMRGLLSHSSSNYQKAISNYYRAIELNQTESAFYFYRGASYYALGRYVSATDDYNQAVSLNNTNPEFYSYPNVVNEVFSNKSQLTNDYQSAQLSGLVVYYPFNNGELIDVSGNNHNGILINTSSSVDINNIPNQAIALNGSAYIKGDASSFPTNDRTISLWFYLLDDSNSHPTVFSYGGNPCGFGFSMSINPTDNAGYYEMQSGCGQNRLSASYTSFPSNQWHHWVVSSDSSNTKMYVDLELVAVNSNPITHTNVNGREFTIGTGVNPNSGHTPYTDSNTGYFSGVIDDFRIYDRTLSQQENITIIHTIQYYVK